MKKNLVNIFIVIFTIIFAIRVITIFTADRLYSMSLAAEKGTRTPESALKLLNVATRLDSTNATLYYQEYKVLNIKIKDEHRASSIQHREDQLHLLRHCINLTPSWPKYHLLYARTLERMSPRPNLMTRQKLLSELEKASKLKPYSPMYKDIYNKYKAKYE